MSDYELESLFKKDNELIYDKAYVHKVFKRVERVCNASFYIADKIKNKDIVQTDTLKKTVEDTVLSILHISSDILQRDTSALKGQIPVLSSALLKLSSLMLLAGTTERIPASHTALIEHEVVTIMGELVEFGRKHHELKLSRPASGRTLPVSRGAADAASYGNTSGTATTPARSSTSSHAVDRKDRIRAIVREKGQVGIKDISDIITDVSEKSIQRDLNDMIEKGEVVRVGERRWSTYRMS